jgi:hypothetical protein
MAAILANNDPWAMFGCRMSLTARHPQCQFRALKAISAINSKAGYSASSFRFLALNEHKFGFLEHTLLTLAA